MKSVLGLLTVVLILAACAVTAPPAGAQAVGAFTGEVWTWDEKAGVITLRQGGQLVRIKAAPDQFAGLQLHETRTIRGVPAPPSEITTFVTPPVPLVASGTPDEMEILGTVTSIDPIGKILITTQRGPVEVWVAQASAPVVKVGDEVRVKMRVQPMVPAPAGQASPPAALEPAASPTSEPGEYAVVRGSLIGVEPSGRLIVESPRGPITVWVLSGSRYKAGSSVEVHTEVHPAH